MIRIICALASLLSGCTVLSVKEEYNSPTTQIEEKILNTFHLKYKDKNIAAFKGDSHKDPNLNGDLIRQEYFINIKF